MSQRLAAQSEKHPHIPAQNAADRVLCVDLDGTLIATDSMQEAVLLLIKSSPLNILRLLSWWTRGRPYLKEQLFAHATPNAALLPYRTDILEFLHEQKRLGRKLVLATGSDQRMARAVADHLGIFDDVIATDGHTNLTRHNKLAELEKRYGPRGFDYMGNSSADLCLWEACGEAYVVDAPGHVLRKAHLNRTPARVFHYPGGAMAAVRALRPHQWVKNFLIFVPLLLAHRMGDIRMLAMAIIAFCAMCMAASSVYLLNDLLDLESDRRHPTKRRRPLPSGELMPAEGMLLHGLLLIGGVGLSVVMLPGGFTAILLIYLVLTLVYSMWIKRLLLVDVITLAVLYTLRIVAGAAAVSVPLTMWLLAFSLFFFVSLAFAKRYSELLDLEAAGGFEAHGRSYTLNDLRIIESVGPASGYMSVLVFCLYLDSAVVQSLYIRSELLWLATPILLYWITRIWFLARRRALHQDPIVFAIKDRISYLAGLALGAMVLLGPLTFRGLWGGCPLPDRNSVPLKSNVAK